MRISDWSSDVCSSDLRVVAIRSMEGIVIARQELWNDIELAIISAANRSSVSASSASTEIRERARRRGRRPASHVIGTTLLAKGARKSVVSGKSVSVRVDRGGRRSIKKNKTKNKER